MALDVEGETHILYFIPVLWAAARNLIATGEPEAAGLTAEIIGGLSYLTMSIQDRELREKLFANPVLQGVAEIVGFDVTTSLAAGDSEGPVLTEEDLSMLRELASGSSQRSPGVDDLLARLGVESENEAIQYAIKAGVTWR